MKSFLDGATLNRFSLCYVSAHLYSIKVSSALMLIFPGEPLKMKQRNLMLKTDADLNKFLNRWFKFGCNLYNMGGHIQTTIMQVTVLCQSTAPRPYASASADRMVSNASLYS